MSDTDTAEQILQGDDTHPDILQALGLELLAEVKWMKKELECWGKLLEVYGINNERMSAALSFAFGDGDSSMSYLESILSLSERDLKWYEDTHEGDD